MSTSGVVQEEPLGCGDGKPILHCATVRLLMDSLCRIYLVGTQHDEPLCCEDVNTVIDKVKPDILFVELCRSRVKFCPKDQLNADDLQERRLSRNFDLRSLYKSVREIGLFGGIVYFSYICGEGHMCCINSGGENGAAGYGDEMMCALEYARLHNCTVIFGDRPLKITMQRQASVLCKTTKAKILLKTVAAILVPYARKSIFANISRSLVTEPNVRRILLDERDVYLTYVLQEVAARSGEKKKVVAIVGKAHIPGIRKLWRKVKKEQVLEILSPVVCVSTC